MPRSARRLRGPTHRLSGRACAGAATHAAGDDTEIGVWPATRLTSLAVLVNRLTSYFLAGASAKARGELLAI